jgi:hypothetical protein
MTPEQREGIVRILQNEGELSRNQAKQKTCPDWPVESSGLHGNSPYQKFKRCPSPPKRAKA